MKKLFYTILLMAHASLFGQIQGISYQALIVDQNAQEIAGVDVSGNILPNREIMVRFTILDAAGTVEFQEEHATQTDAFGIINLTIGLGNPTSGSPKAFIEIDWDGTAKQLKVDLSISDTDVFYTDFSLQELTFIPYAFHKNITATGTLTVANKSTLQDLSVEASTNLNGSLDVNNASPTRLTGMLSVEKRATIEDTLTVNASSDLNGRVTITAETNGNDDAVESYPLYVKGSNQGIAIKVDGSRENSKNFVTFWDDAGVQGRIEGETAEEIYTDPIYIYENLKLVFDLGVAASELVAASTSSTACIGLFPCVTTPSISEIAFGIAQVAIATTDITLYNLFRLDNAGVTYQSKGADYAEYLPKEDPNDVFLPGDVVGIRGGVVSHNTENAHKIMVVSRNPIVVGNIPEEGSESNYVKIAFIGQVETKISSKANVGDFIIPSGKNDGYGIAVSPEEITSAQYLKVVGTAWTQTGDNAFGYVNVAVGINTTDLARLQMKLEEKIKEQQSTIDQLQQQLEQMNRALAKLLPEYAALTGTKPSTQQIPAAPQPSGKTVATQKQSYQQLPEDTAQTRTDDDRVVYYQEINRDHIVKGINIAKEMIKEKGKLEDHPLFMRLETDAAFKEIYIEQLLKLAKEKVDEAYQKDLEAGVNAVKVY
jgi:hypothetical protein